MTKIAIDAGHGLYTAGKRCMKALDKNETREWILNDRIADKLEKLLKNYDCEVLRTDDTDGSSDISLANRCRSANNWKADVFISIHHNAGVNGGSGGGTVVYYYSSNAARKTQALSLYNLIVGQTGLKGNRANKVLKNAFYVLKNTNAPAFLIENGFMDSKTDVPIILTEDHANRTATGILNFLVNEFKLKRVTQSTTEKVETPATSTSGTLYKVQSGAFSKKANAEALQKKLKTAGFEAVIVVDKN